MKKVIGLAVVATVMVATAITLYGKAHVVRNCSVVQVNDGYVTVRHPNDEVYDFFAEDAEKYEEDTVIRISFNELKFDKDSYEINLANPKPIKERR